MPWIRDPRLRSRLLEGAAVAVALGAVGLAVAWARQPARIPALPEAIEQRDPPADAAAAPPRIDPSAWRHDLWQPLRDPPPEPPPDERDPPPMHANLIAIAERGGRPVAVLEVDPDGPLRYLPAGADVAGYTVERIEGRRAVLSRDGRETVLELPR